MNQIFSYTQRNGSLTEYYQNGAFYFLYKNEEAEHKLSLYEINPQKIESNEWYLGYTKEEILASGRDLLGERLTKNGDPNYKEVKSVLPPLSKAAYTILGGVASVAGLTVDSDGVIYTQASGRNRSEQAIFTPAEYDSTLGVIKPRQILVGKKHPLLLSVHTDGTHTLEFLYFVEPTEPNRDPICWIRIKRYFNASPDVVTMEYRVAAIAREASADEHFDTPPTEELFWDALLDTVSYWVDFSMEGVNPTLPEEELALVTQGALSFAALTYTCEHAHYGHRFYGQEIHDNFPPNYIFMIEAMVCLGRPTEAHDIFSHFLKYVLRHDGKINYRQGLGLNFGASATEYGMLLHLAGRYRRILLSSTLQKVERRGLIGMGEEILTHMVECNEADGLLLIKTCAEADTNERIHVYLNNNLWAIRGLEALASILGNTEGAKYRTASQTLRTNVSIALARYGATDTRFGALPPFRIGYTATPLTLSHCRESFFPLEKGELDRYLAYAWKRSDLMNGEDLIENTYANYRYYPEMLSSMLLPKEYCDAFVKMRESIGGELLGMTRFVEQIDDWPVLNYARFLLESGRIEKYLLLMYAHAAHHGSPDTMTYYEQVTCDGRACANDCIPSFLTVPTMLAWSFAYEDVDQKALHLLSALPKEWYHLPFRVKGLGYSGGKIDISSNGSEIEVHFDQAPTMPVEIVLRAKNTVFQKDIQIGAEYIEKIRENVLLLKPNVKDIILKIK